MTACGLLWCARLFLRLNCMHSELLIDGHKVMLQRHVFGGDLCPDGRPVLISQTLSRELLMLLRLANLRPETGATLA